ncbi:UDP-N-acetylmuramate dehydrogenase [Longispora albida]|uniref:UDP-N-acetylmuramate dehydrogenase n=1 Tax=Longispora albida TaxID=203523 RepID=UPI000373730A|nr:UDP-N-acetylmuramate dehydrogenase [Longispora albida]
MQQRLDQYTTLRLGGPARDLIEVHNAAETIAAVKTPGRLLLLAGGSNVVIGDAGFDGTVVLLRSRGLSMSGGELTVEAGHPWDEVVEWAVASGYSGVEALSGIPGSAGATPIQNVGAYGQEIAERVVSVELFDRQTGQTEVWGPERCGFSYRNSVFKNNERFVLLRVTLRLEESAVSAPIRYAELARALGVEAGERVPLEAVRPAVLKLRAGKGMVLDPADPDTYSAGSFFTNPIVHSAPEGSPHWPHDGGMVKVSAAWLIENAGFPKGYRKGGVGISTKHTLALTNRGEGTAAELLALAEEIEAGVRARFGIDLHPEPVLV